MSESRLSGSSAFEPVRATALYNGREVSLCVDAPNAACVGIDSAAFDGAVLTLKLKGRMETFGAVIDPDLGQVLLGQPRILVVLFAGGEPVDEKSVPMPGGAAHGAA